MSTPDATTYPAGMVAVATVRGVPNVRLMCADLHMPWVSSGLVEGDLWHGDQDVTDVRPLTVLDLPHPAHTVEALREAQAALPSDAGLFREVADQLEAQNKPPRIPEPGLWGVVEARDGLETQPSMPRMYLRDSDKDEDAHWTCIGSSRRVEWEDLIDPVQVRPGVDD